MPEIYGNKILGRYEWICELRVIHNPVRLKILFYNKYLYFPLFYLELENHHNKTCLATHIIFRKAILYIFNGNIIEKESEVLFGKIVCISIWNAQVWLPAIEGIMRLLDNWRNMHNHCERHCSKDRRHADVLNLWHVSLNLWVSNKIFQNGETLNKITFNLSSLHYGLIFGESVGN